MPPSDPPPKVRKPSPRSEQTIQSASREAGASRWVPGWPSVGGRSPLRVGPYCAARGGKSQSNRPGSPPLKWTGQ